MCCSQELKEEVVHTRQGYGAETNSIVKGIMFAKKTLEIKKESTKRRQEEDQKKRKKSARKIYKKYSFNHHFKIVDG